MLAPLLTIVATALLCLLAEMQPRLLAAARYLAALGSGAALILALFTEGVEGAVLGAEVAWPDAFSWLGAPIFRSDALGAGLGIWCLFLGGLCVVKLASDSELPVKLAVALLTTASLYALVHTTNLLAFAVATVLLVGLIWGYHAADNNGGASAVRQARQLLALGLGAAMLMGAIALMGRTSGGIYDIIGIPIPTFSVWPLLLLSGFVLLWLGSLPLIGWSAGEGRGAFGTMVQSLVLFVPVAALLLRLETLFSAQALAGAIPQGWTAFTDVLAWLGAATALAGSARALLMVGTSGFLSSLTAYWAGLMIWALALDTPLSRYAAIALLVTWGAGRVLWELAEANLGEERWDALPRLVAAISLTAAPLSAGFVGVWILAEALAESGRPALALLPVGIAVLGAIGVTLNMALLPRTKEEPTHRTEQQYAGRAAAALGVALATGGVVPGLWLPFVGGIAATAGGSVPAAVSWTGIKLANGAELPLFLLAVGAAALGTLGWIATVIAGRGKRRGGALLPPAITRLQEPGAISPLQRGSRLVLGSLFQNPPAPVRVLSLAGVERVLLGVGGSFTRILTRSGALLGRLEGRYYLPLALVLTLLFLLAVTR